MNASTKRLFVGNNPNIRPLEETGTHKQMQESIQSHANEWQSTFDSIKDPIMILDSEFCVVRVNAATVSFFGLALDQILGNHCSTLMRGINKPVETCSYDRLCETRRCEEE